MGSDIRGHTAAEAYHESWWFMRNHAVKEDSRNGPVMTVPYPVILEIQDPRRRLIMEPVRDANPFFHCMEFIWMMAGGTKVQWLAQFNKRMNEYAEDGVLRGAYGHRWREMLGVDQLETAVKMLEKDPTDRRIVLQMWDAFHDLGRGGKDQPCNTQIYLRVVDQKLDFLVCNRSNDLIWGMLGANVVHMTMLQELIAQAAGLGIGKYRVVSNNLHVYTGMPKFEQLWRNPPDLQYWEMEYSDIPLLQGTETIADFFHDCEQILREKVPTEWKTEWVRHVGLPILMLWWSREKEELELIKSPYWREACRRWLNRRSHG